jgi:hypothetical protein
MRTVIASIHQDQYPALSQGTGILKTIRFNLNGEAVTPHDLNRIQVPLGGSTIWTVAEGDGAETARKVLEGIILRIARRRACWSSSGPSGDPPDCSSNDCLHGLGRPGGSCAACLRNRFGTAKKPDGSPGRGKACKETKLLFLLREGCLLPDVVTVPASGLKALRQFQLKLGLPYWSVLTSLALEKAQNKDRILYSTIQPSARGALPDDVARQVVAYANALQSVFAAVTVRQDDVRDADTREA